VGRLLVTLGTAALLARAIRDRGGTRRLASQLLHHYQRGPRSPARHEIEESRLYTHRRRRLGAHLTRRADGRVAVLALPLDGSRRAATYLVDEHRPWHDFERQARLIGAPWGPCRDMSSGL
jgi:hypothetical protein